MFSLRIVRATSSVRASVSRRGYKAPLQDTKFLINNVYDFQSHYKKLKGGENATPDIVDSILEESAKFCENVLAPLNEVADSEGCKFISAHEVKTPAGFKEAYHQYVEAGWHGISFPEKYGGQGFPSSMNIIKSEMVATSNFTWGMFPGLSLGCMNTLLLHGTDELKEKYLHKLTEGVWTGTMCLTEPQCGSDLAQVKTKAVPTTSGTYKITGTKIFISCGEHDMTENIIHCVLARLPNAPEGTKGISLFLVPKLKVKADGSVGELNGVNLGRIEDKMGCHGSPTCELNFEDAEGYLIGTENRGLNHMFTFINTSRLGTAIQGVGAAELAFQRSLAYARERLSMRSLTGIKAPEKPADPLIVHPDIRKMLLTQKAIAEGGRAMIYDCAMLADRMQAAELSGDKKTVAAMDDRMGFLTPVLKGFLTEMGLEAANLGVQIWGGHGYIKQNKMEQIIRDTRIASVWEGTTGIQALDLLGRKIMLQKLKPMGQHAKVVYGQCFSSLKGPHRAVLLPYIATLLKQTTEWQYLTLKIAAKARKDRDIVGSSSVDYLMYAGFNIMGFHWLRMAEAALDAKAKNPNKSEFYDAKLQTANFFFTRMMPRTRSYVKTMIQPTSTVMAMKDEHFQF